MQTLRSLAAGVVCLAAACATGPAVQSEANQTTPAADGVALLVRNHSDDIVCFVYAWPTHLSEHGTRRGPDRLGPSEVIAIGEGRAWDLEPGTYDLSLWNCQEEPLMERRAIPIDDRGLVMTFRARER
jgi:hypothetical protein